MLLLLISIIKEENNPTIPIILRMIDCSVHWIINQKGDKNTYSDGNPTNVCCLLSIESNLQDVRHIAQLRKLSILAPECVRSWRQLVVASWSPSLIKSIEL